MKMEKYSTKRKVDSEIDDFLDHVKEFATSELYDLLRRSQGDVIYSPDSRTYILGRYGIQSVEDGLWQVMTAFGEVEHVFCNKQASLLYAMAIMRNRYVLAERLRKTDHAYLLAKSEYLHYRQRLSRAQLNDDFKIGLYAAKITTAKSRLTNARIDLEKSLEMAKYLKLGT